MNAPDASLRYQCGFGNHFASEAVPGTLPVGRNSPQRVERGLYAELLSGSAPRDAAGTATCAGWPRAAR